MIIGNKEIDVKNNANDDINEKPYDLSSIISPIFGLHHQKITPVPVNMKKNNNCSTMIKEYVDKKTKANIFHEKEVAYNNASNLDNTRVTQMQKDKEQKQIYDSLSSRYFEFREKMFKQDMTIDYNNLNSSDTVITTIDLLIDDILDGNK